MSDDIDVVPEGYEVIGKLTPEEYWEWRCTIEEDKSAEFKHKYMAAELVARSREIVIMQLKLEKFKSQVKEAQSDRNKAKDEYIRFRGKLEKNHGLKLQNCVIDDITYEIRSLIQEEEGEE